MTWEPYLLWGALGAFGAALLVDLGPAADAARRSRAVRGLALVGAASLVVALLILAIYFLAGHLETEYVFTYSRLDYPWHYRLAGLWAGQKGTLLMWATFTALFGLAALRKTDRALVRGDLGADAAEYTRAFGRVLLVVAGLLTASTLVAKTFEATDPYFLQRIPDGNGLQPVLITPFMIIHPPIQFLAYALSGVIFAAAVAHVATGHRSWAPIIRPWVRLAWVLATIGLGLGGLWAYYVLNFGGFWAWDPVETANLIAWFPLTLLLHGLLRYEKGDYTTAAPLFALLTLPLTLFSTVSTRTGLWVSVHAFTDPSKNFARDPLVRLLNILETSDLLQYLAALFAASLLLALYAVLLGRTRQAAGPRAAAVRGAGTGLVLFAGLFVFLDTPAAFSVLFQAAHAVTLGRSAPVGLLLIAVGLAALVLLSAPEELHVRAEGVRPAFWNRWLTTRRLLTLGITLLGLALLVVFLLDILQVNGYERAVYDDRAPLVALPIFLTLATLFLRPALGPRNAAIASITSGGVGVAAALLVRDHWQVLLVLPSLLLAAFASLQRLLAVATSGGTAPARDRHAGLALVVGALIGYLYWGNPPTQIDLAVATLRPSWFVAIPAYAACTLALAAGLVHGARPQPALARAGAVALLLVLGNWGLASLCGLAALVLLVRAAPATRPLPEVWRERRPSLRKSAIYLTHVGLCLGLAGFALATYESAESDVLAVDETGGGSFQGYALRLLGSEGVGRDAKQGLPEEIHARVLVLQGGEPLEEATLVYWLVHDNKLGHYDARVTVVRRAVEDVYLFPVSFTTPHATLTDHINDARPTDPTVTNLTLTVKTLPGMGLVWTGLWLLGLGMASNLALGGFAIAPAARPRPQEAAPPPPDGG